MYNRIQLPTDKQTDKAETEPDTQVDPHTHTAVEND